MRICGGERGGGEILHAKRHGCDGWNAIVNENEDVTRGGHGMNTGSVSGGRGDTRDGGERPRE